MKNSNDQKSSGTYSQIYIHLVFAVRWRQHLIDKSWRETLFKYMAGIIKEKGAQSLIVNGVSDHVHCLIRLRPTHVVSDLVREIKNNSSKFINESGLINGKFYWQEGYAVFSVSQSGVGRVTEYISDQEKHHEKTTFREEYIGLLNEHGIEFKNEYLFEFRE